jgi:hypothetical protein
MTRPPPATVLERFGASGTTPAPLPGGRGTAWRAGDVVLEPLDLSPAALRWQEEVLSSVVPDGFRVAAPLGSRGGELIVGGWTAWPALDGAYPFAPGLPPAVIDLSPYWRPVAYASAIVAVDAVLWHGADAAALVPPGPAGEARPLIVRALLFRLLAEADPAAAATEWGPAIDRLLGR